MPNPPDGAWTVEPLLRDELPQVGAIEADVFPEPLSLVDLEALYADPATCYLAVRDGQRLAAYIGFQVFGPTAHVISNATHPGYRNLGLGSLVVRAAEPEARKRGARWFLAEVRRSNSAQFRLLRRLGWREVGLCPGFFGNGEDAVVVWRLIPCAEDSR